MFTRACVRIMPTLYAYWGNGKLSSGSTGWGFGTAFMIAPGVLATAAHVLFAPSTFDLQMSAMAGTLVMRATAIGQESDNARLIAIDPSNDLALLRIDNPRSTSCVRLASQQIPVGTQVGSLGFPLARSTAKPVVRFTSAYISAFYKGIEQPGLGFAVSGEETYYYETDAMMYSGASGSPGFLTDGTVFGLHSRSLGDPFRKPPEQPDSDESKLQLSNRLALSVWVPSSAIIAFAEKNGVALQNRGPRAAPRGGARRKR